MFTQKILSKFRISHILVLLVIFVTFFHSVECHSRVLLQHVQALTLQRGQYTTGRRSSPVPQLQCIGGTAAGKYSPKTVQCYNRGFDGRDVQWECKSELSDDFQFGRISVTCEGFDYPDDPYILGGSCGLEYELDYTAKGAQKYGRKTPSAPPLYEYVDKYTSGWNFSTIVYIVIAAFIIYLIYLIVTSEQQDGGYRSGGGSGSNDHRPDHPGNLPPPGWFRRPPTAPPSYDETMGSAKTGPSTSQQQPSSGPGFWTGMGLGALGGYLYGQNNGNSYRRRQYGPTQFERDTGFYDSSYDQPSTSRRYSPGPSTSTHTSTGYGGTSRR